MEDAMVTDLQASDHGRASRLIPLWIALVNGLSPLIISLLIMLPLWLGSRIGPGFWLWAGLRTLLLGLLICGIILQVSTV
jgi:hypothetical protein